MNRKGYAKLIERAEALEQAAVRAEDKCIKASFWAKAQVLRGQAEEMCVEDA